MFHDQNIIPWPLIRLRALRTGNKEHRNNVSINSGNFYTQVVFMFINLCMSEPFYIEKEFFVGGYFVTFNLITKTCKFKVIKSDLDLITLI